MTVSARTHAHLSAAAQGERIGPSPPFLFPAGLDRLLVVADPSCLGRAHAGVSWGTDRGRFLAIHPLPPPSWLCISTARTSSRSSSPPGRARRQGSTDSTRIPCTSARTTSRVQQQCPSPCSSLSRRKIRWAVWRCFLGRLRSSTRIWSMTPVKGSSLGRRGGVCRR